jgi:hypothetical protein
MFLTDSQIAFIPIKTLLNIFNNVIQTYHFNACRSNNYAPFNILIILIKKPRQKFFDKALTFSG